MAVKKDVGSRLAFGGIGAAVSLIFVVLGYFLKYVSLSCYVLSSIGIMLPLTKKYYREALLASVAVSVIGFFIVRLSIIPFVMASGFYVVLSIFLYQKRFNRWIGYGIKFLYAGLIFFICYKLVTLITIDFSKLPILDGLDGSGAGFYAILNLIFAFAFLIYDFLLEKGFDYMVKITEKINKKH